MKFEERRENGGRRGYDGKEGRRGYDGKIEEREGEEEGEGKV